MSFFVVGYDFDTTKGTKPDYAPITKLIEALDSCRPQESFWLVRADWTSDELYDYLIKEVRTQDRLMIIELDDAPAWNQVLPDAEEWMIEHFFED